MIYAGVGVAWYPTSGFGGSTLFPWGRCSLSSCGVLVGIRPALFLSSLATGPCSSLSLPRSSCASSSFVVALARARRATDHSPPRRRMGGEEPCCRPRIARRETPNYPCGDAKTTSARAPRQKRKSTRKRTQTLGRACYFVGLYACVRVRTRVRSCLIWKVHTAQN